MFTTVLIANRGEIACRIIRTLSELGITSVAVYTDPDRGAKHVTLADTAVHIDDYLDSAAIIDAARATGAQAIHPGYGFLSENVDFARDCERAGIVFIGPSVDAIEAMGDKIRAKAHVTARGVKVTPGAGDAGMTDAQLIEAAAGVGYPLLIKPSGGGGGKGMTVVESPDELPEALITSRRVATKAFGDDTLLLERLIATPRHIEVQVLADSHGHVIHLGERECSLQRRHQKVVEEAPSPLLDDATRAAIGEAACEVARSVDYTGAGTVEFLVSDANPGEFFFMEMNTRLQVEHPVTELVTGIDLVAWQLRIAAGEHLTLGQDDVTLTGHAIEVRLYAEDPATGFLPTTGAVVALREPDGEGVRVDSSLVVGLDVASVYDPMLAKIIAWGEDRDQAITRLERALTETTVLGLRTNRSFLASLLADPDVKAGRLDTGLVERILAGLDTPAPDASALATAALLEHASRWHTGSGDGRRTGGNAGSPWTQPTGSPSAQPTRWHAGSPWAQPTGWRVGEHRASTYTIGDSTGDTRVAVLGAPENTLVDGVPVRFRTASGDDGETVTTERDGVSVTYRWARDGNVIWLASGTETWNLQIRSREELLVEHRASLSREEGAANPEVRSVMPGTVVSVSVETGDAVVAGQPLLALEAMKMEHPLLAPMDGTVTVTVAVGDQVRLNQVVARIEPGKSSPGESSPAAANAVEAALPATTRAETTSTAPTGAS